MELFLRFLFHRMKLGHTIDDSRKKYPEITDELLKSLQKWADDRELPTIPEEQLALFAHSCHFDLAATKQCMHAYYTMRATIPEFFHDRDPRREYLQHSLKALYALIDFNQSFLINLTRVSIKMFSMLIEYIRIYFFFLSFFYYCICRVCTQLSL